MIARDTWSPWLRTHRWAFPAARIAVSTEVRIWLVVAVVVRITFWITTDRVWEDALITVAHARNAVAGLGLTHHPGEPLTHGFTSAISVLVPLLGEAMATGSGVFAMRIASLAAAAVTILAAGRWSSQFGLSVWPRRLAFAYLAFDPLQVFYGMSGMETQIAVAALLWSAVLLIEDRLRPILIGVSLGIALLARPDFLLWVVVVLWSLLVRNRAVAVRAAVAGTIVVAPWLLFTTLYYGSPIPQTILAKAAALTEPIGSSPVGWLIDRAIAQGEPILRTFAPFYEDSMVASAPLAWIIAAAVAALMWTFLLVGIPRTWRKVPAVPLALAAFLIYRVIALPTTYFDWYAVPVAALGVLVAAVGVDVGLAHRPRGRVAVSALLAGILAIPLVWTIPLEARIQQEAEVGVRIPTAEYVRQVVPPGEPVATESAGYFGYYSGATLYDYPGLTSRTALNAILSLPPGDRGMAAMLSVLRAPWIVVRPSEFAALAQRDPTLAGRYVLCRQLGTTDAGPTISWNGLVKVNVDLVFQVRALDGCPSGS